MRPIPAVLSAVLALTATSALAQASPSNAATQRGFFSSQPQSDPSLFRTLPAEAYQPPPAESSATPSAAPEAPANAGAATGTNGAAANRPLVVVVPEGGSNGVQEQFDRAQLEAQQAQGNRAPAPINGAFTGNTDPNNR